MKARKSKRLRSVEALDSDLSRQQTCSFVDTNKEVVVFSLNSIMINNIRDSSGVTRSICSLEEDGDSLSLACRFDETTA